MTMLDTRARRAAAAIDHSVAAFTPTVTVGDLARRAAWHRTLNYVGALAVVVVVVVVGAFLRTVTQADDVVDTLPPEPVVTTSVAPIEQPDIVVPTDPEQIVPPAVVEDGEDTDTAGEPAEVPPPVPEAPAEPPVVDTEPPFIAVTSPSDGATVEKSVIRFEGETEPGATVAAGRYDADVDASGAWAITLVVSPGGNRATFTATDAAGNTATTSITVYYEPPEEPKPPKVHEFSAFATFGSCDLDPPYDVYYGTSDPGEKITIISEFGDGVVNADAEGNWELKVFFPTAPFGKAFLVKVKDTKGNAKNFEFVSYAGEGV